MRAVQRIDNPGELALADLPALLGENGVARVAALELADDLGLGGAVDFADEVVPLLLHDRNAAHAVEVP